MKTEYFLAAELAALVLPLLAMAAAQLATEKWKVPCLVFGQMAALFNAASAVLVGLSGMDADAHRLGSGTFSLRLDFASACLITGMTFITTVVLSFSERYLGGEKYRLTFLYLVTFLSSCAAWLTCTDSMAVACVFWCLLSVGLYTAVRLHAPERASAQVVLRHHLLSDVCMIASAMLLYGAVGTSQFSQLSSVTAGLNSHVEAGGVALPVTYGTCACSLLVLAFSIKSALFPFHRWLLATLDAPTPLSGLLHAGVVNVSAIMAWRLMPVLQTEPAVLTAWGTIAALSAIAGTLSMSAQPDVKRKLVYSTVGQMGFMALQCASGALGAALFHMVAHGLFKCHMFLQSGNAVAEGVNKRKFGWSTSELPGAKDGTVRKLVVVTVAVAACIAIYELNMNHCATWVSTVIAASALLTAVPSMHRITPTSLVTFWVTVMAVVTGAALLCTGFEQRLSHTPGYGQSWLLPTFLLVFASLATILQLAKNSEWSKALYVHSLNGFYIDDIASRSKTLTSIRRTT